jgi:hypothetical protein
MTPIRALLENLIDYAGLFPPSALPMAAAAANYQRYRQSAEQWMLARFVVPVSRLDEMEAAWTGPAPLVSALIGNDVEADLARIAKSPLPIDTIELKAAQFGPIPRHLTPYVELTDLSMIPALRAAGARAKIRTGGVTPEAFPAASAVAAFITACARENVPFKATAGLHHPLRCYRPLTYESGGPSGWMFGFLNVFVAATLARKGVTELEPVLLAETFDDHGLTAEDFASARREFAISFGSCSFEEPVADLRALGLL